MKNRFFPLMEEAGDAGATGGGGVTQTASTGQGQAATGTLLSSSGTGANSQTSQTQQSATVEPYYKDWLKADGTLNHAAYDRLPDHLKPAAESLKKYGKIDEVLGAFWHHQQLVGKKGLMPLPDNADDKAKGEFNARLREILRVPEKPEGYGITKPDTLPAELWNEDALKGGLAILHKHNASPELVKELTSWNFKFGETEMARIQGEQAKQVQQANEEINQAFGADRDKKLALAQRGARTLGLDVNDPSIGNNPKVIIAMARMAELISEDKLVTGASEANAGLSDKAKAEDVIYNKANPLNAAYHDPNHPMHSTAVQQVLSYNKAFHESTRRKAG